MAGERKQLAQILGAYLPQLQMIPDLRTVGELDPAYTGYAQIVRKRVTPASHGGSLSLEYELWLCRPNVDLEQVEDELEDLAEQLIDVLEPLTWITWTEAARDAHPNTADPAIRFELTASSIPR